MCVVDASAGTRLRRSALDHRLFSVIAFVYGKEEFSL